MGLHLKTATIQILKGKKRKFVVTEFDVDCIGMKEVDSSLISYKEYTERKINRRVALYDTQEEASKHVKEYQNEKENSNS